MLHRVMLKQRNMNMVGDLCHGIVETNRLRTPCQHVFHNNCFRSSLGDTDTLECVRCPICRDNIAFLW